jgi:hypothetical protein
MKGKKRKKKDKDRRLIDEISSGLRVMDELFKNGSAQKKNSQSKGEMNDLLYNLENKKDNE